MTGHGTSNGIRIHVVALRGLCPGPLDDGGSYFLSFYHGFFKNRKKQEKDDGQLSGSLSKIFFLTIFDMTMNSSVSRSSGFRGRGKGTFISSIMRAGRPL